MTSSFVTLKLLGSVGILAIFGSLGNSDATPVDQRATPALCAAARRWRAKYPNRDDLTVNITTVTFRGNPGDFVPGEGTIVAPVAVDMPGLQEVLDVDGFPAPARVLHAGAVTALAWLYAGTVHRDIRAVGLALVSRPVARDLILPSSPTFQALPADQKGDATLVASDLEEHRLESCKAFADWARQLAGDPPFTDQVLRVARSLAQRTRRDVRRKKDDPCASLRDEFLSPHEAHMLAVMAARQAGIPSYGFIGGNSHLYVGTYVDGVGWATLDLESAEPRYRVGGPGLITAAPLVTHFEASEDGFWGPAGSAYSAGPFGVSALSRTRWANPSDSGDTTSIVTMPLRDACP